MSSPIDVDITDSRLSGRRESARRFTLAEAQRYCGALARRHYENFNVGGWITPNDKLPHVYAIYAWCRTVDDLGDEGTPEGAAGVKPTLEDVARHRLERLDWWESELDAAYDGQPTHPVAIALQHTIFRFDIPPEPFRRLIQANRMDQRSGRFATMEDVLHYCRHSANPVGHLYLYLFGHSDPELQELADQTCTALQLTNFWQDVARDYRDRDRIYLPQADLAHFQVMESDIATGNASRQFRDLLRYESEFAMQLFRQGAPLVSRLERRARLPVALFTRGGVAILDAIRGQDYDVLSRRPSLSSRRKGWLLASAWLGSLLGFGYGLPSGKGGP
jgi:squalene synthase HpnC